MLRDAVGARCPSPKPRPADKRLISVLHRRGRSKPTTLELRGGYGRTGALAVRFRRRVRAAAVLHVIETTLLDLLTAYAPASWRSVTAAWRRSSTVSSSSPSSSRRARIKVARWIASKARNTRPRATSQAVSQTRRVTSHSSHRAQMAVMSRSASASRSSPAAPSARSLMSARHDSTRARREDTRTRAERIRRSISGQVPLSSVARSTADVSRYRSVSGAGSEPIAPNLVEQPGRRARGQAEPLDLPGPVTLRQARAGEFPRLGQSLKSFLDGQPGGSLSVRGAELGDDFITVG